ncbi:MAG: UDP-N-acetylglucosamine--N-acetylmuramyl-(pentapeptide) pyrophosphoryl-undecaprenol [Verrucomicrobiales bacterium]|nr:UDP-N-acetylglucosamine--N-acetylmuramyl-(pentapeptide) pyrophosphoryl-undecaprenol [Verrucomicrobiales bacterium]
MRNEFATPKNIAIACGGTGGHLFPGIAIAHELARRECDVTLIVSKKEFDQQAVASVAGKFKIVSLPAVGLTGKNYFAFGFGLTKSVLLALRHFRKNRPDAVIAMGGFTSVAPVLAGKMLDAKTYLHESNSIAGRANRWLARLIDLAFVYFPSTTMRAKKIEALGMPVRAQFSKPMRAAVARRLLGLEENAPVLLIMGGSQGASGINDLALNCSPLLREAIPNLQILHLTGKQDFEIVQKAYAAQNCPAVVRAFLNEMDLALTASDVAISRAGASSLAEFAATRLPAVLIPYPTAADNHQFHNARAFVESGAARMFEQSSAEPHTLTAELIDIINNPQRRASMQQALERWDRPTSASEIADRILGRPTRIELPTQSGEIRTV